MSVDILDAVYDCMHEYELSPDEDWRTRMHPYRDPSTRVSVPARRWGATWLVRWVTKARREDRKLARLFRQRAICRQAIKDYERINDCIKYINKMYFH